MRDPVSYREWVAPSAGMVAIVGGIALAAGVVGLGPWGARGFVVAAVATLAVLGAGLLAWSPSVRVQDGLLVTRHARAPLEVVRSITVLDAEATRLATGPDLDARAHLELRPWVRTTARVELADPGDPTPYWLVSCRHPARLAEAVARASAQ